MPAKTQWTESYSQREEKEGVEKLSSEDEG